MQQHEGCSAARKVADIQAAAIALNTMSVKARKPVLSESVMILPLFAWGPFWGMSRFSSGGAGSAKRNAIFEPPFGRAFFSGV